MGCCWATETSILPPIRIATGRIISLVKTTIRPNYGDRWRKLPIVTRTAALDRNSATTGPVWFLRCCRWSTSNIARSHGSQRCLRLRWSCRFPFFRAVGNCGLAPPAFFPSQEQRRPLVAEVSRSPDKSHGTVYLLGGEHSNYCLLRLLASVWRLISSTVIDCSLRRIFYYLVSNLRCV